MTPPGENTDTSCVEEEEEEEEEEVEEEAGAERVQEEEEEEEAGARAGLEVALPRLRPVSTCEDPRPSLSHHT